MSEIDEQADGPGWVRRMREKGYTVTVGTGELSPEPEVDFFTPPLPVANRTPTRVVRLRAMLRKGFAHLHQLAQRRRHAALP